MVWEVLSFLAVPSFVIPWYLIGFIGAGIVIYDIKRHNTPLKPAIAWGWPIIVLFFSVIGLALYYLTARAPHIEDIEDPKAKKAAHDRYQENMFRRVNGAVIHCVAGDGLGIMTGMVIARATGMSFWQEFWFEYLVGFLFGWLIFQLKSMRSMTDSLPQALAMAFRAEFFSMLTVMGGMGAVMTYVTPGAVGAQPKPLTYAFWGFGMLGLLVGYVFTFPMNWAMVRLGWKHGMGSPEGARPIRVTGPRMALLGGMVALGAAGLVLPAWLTEVRDRASAEPAGGSSSILPLQTAAPGTAGTALRNGLREQLETAARDLQRDRTSATTALDAARRIAAIALEAAPGSVPAAMHQTIRHVRHELQTGDPASARRELMAAVRALASGGAPPLRPPSELAAYEGATVVDARGTELGEVTGVRGTTVSLELGGRRDMWGLVDVGRGTRVSVPSDALVFGPAGTIGPHLVALASSVK